MTTYIWPEGGGGGITELTGDVTAGPGSGSQAATVQGLQTYPVSSAAPALNEVLTWDGAQWIPSPAAPSGFDLSFQGENTGTSPLVIGAVYLPAITLTVASRVLLGVVGAGTATLRLVEQATSTVVATWTQTGALTDVPLGAPTAALAAGWYVFDLAGSAAGTITRCYGAHLE